MEFLCRNIVLLLGLSIVLAVKSEPVPNGEASRAEAEDRDGILIDMRVLMGYSDSWAVEVKGGDSEADRIAKENGFVNLGQVY